mmetsp:Transcript_9599/g.35940  ORF Transcript_9599/g.35940 Transcript_9599/m.35940 type:complete len:131 (-) Transcript_9599:577-969(-)
MCCCPKSMLSSGSKTGLTVETRSASPYDQTDVDRRIEDGSDYENDETVGSPYASMLSFDEWRSHRGLFLPAVHKSCRRFLCVELPTELLLQSKPLVLSNCNVQAVMQLRHGLVLRQQEHVEAGVRRGEVI